jgi:NAD(P)-dependent dehydrogenase (short-subunit alcohol dehydrogenase family)
LISRQGGKAVSDAVAGSSPILERFRLDGRTALVTGGGQGIGRAYAHALGEAGARVAVVDISEEHARTVTAELESKGIGAMPVVADVTKEAQVRDMVRSVVDRWGGLTIGVNNAGIGIWADARTMEKGEWDRLMAINLDAVFLCAQAEADVMLEAGYGKIINTASMSAHIVNWPQNQVAYNTSKAGVLHMTRSLATEWAAGGIRVNSISPGYTRTLLVQNLLESPEVRDMEARWLERTPMARMAEVTDLQGAVVYLASQASDFVTGSDIVIDGGYCAW